MLDLLDLIVGKHAGLGIRPHVHDPIAILTMDSADLGFGDALNETAEGHRSALGRHA